MKYSRTYRTIFFGKDATQTYWGHRGGCSGGMWTEFKVYGIKNIFNILVERYYKYSVDHFKNKKEWLKHTKECYLRDN